MDRKFLIGIGIATLLILVGGIWLVSLQDKPLMGEEIPVQNTTHIKQGEPHPLYNSNPPTSGWMYDGVAGAGIHDQEVSDELLVHSMEHGAAVVWYKQDLPADQVDKLKNIFTGASGKKIMLPRTNLDAPVALTSWSRLLKLQSVDEAIIKRFIETNNDRAPEKAPI